MDSPDFKDKPSWLIELQLKSWEPEILLSGIVLYGMFQLPDALDSFLFYFQHEVFNTINAMDLLVALLKVGVYWLIFGLILHLVCRGLWVGMVGLSYSFPFGVNIEKLKFQPRYRKKVEGIPPFDQIVLRLERICSFIYSVSFLLFMSLVGTYIFATVLIIIPMLVILFSVDSFDESLANSLNAYGNWVMTFGFIGVIDFITLGYFRRFKLIAWIYWPIYRLFSYLTLSKFYRPTYYAIATNLNRWALFGFFLLFVMISIIAISTIQFSGPRESFSQIEIWSDEQGEEAFEGYYQDKENATASVRLQIPSDVIRDDVLRVFIPTGIGQQDSLKKFVKYDSISTITEESFEEGRYFLNKLSEFYSLSIDDSTFRPRMYFQRANSTNQKGVIAYLDIGYLEEGLYELKLTGPPEMVDDTLAIVPFYKLDGSRN